MKDQKEKMILFNFKLPRDMWVNLDLVKRVTGVTKGMHIRAALEPYLEQKLIENEFMINSMDRVFAIQRQLSNNLNKKEDIPHNKGVADEGNPKQEDVSPMLAAEDSIEKAG